MKNFDMELGGRFSTRILMAIPQGQTKKPFREKKQKEQRKPDYSKARQQKRGDFQD